MICTCSLRDSPVYSVERNKHCNTACRSALVSSGFEFKLVQLQED